MAWTLNDILAMPTDPEKLEPAMRMNGMLPAVEEQPAAAAVIPAMTPPREASTAVAPMRPPAESRATMPAMKSAELAEPTEAVKPMRMPLAPMEPNIPSAGALPYAAPPTPGTVPFYQGQFEGARAAARPDKMEEHPSFLGKVGHVLGRIGNIGLDVFAPGVAERLPGTDIYKRENVEQAAANLAAAQQRESKQRLEAAEARKFDRETQEHNENIEQALTSAARNYLAKGGDPAKMNEDPTVAAWQRMKDDNAKSADRNETIEQGLAGAVRDYLAKGGDPAKMDADPVVAAWQKKRDDNVKAGGAANTPATPEAIADYQAKLKQVGLDSKSAETFSQVPPGITMGELEKRYTDAKALREMGQKDRENAIRDQERRDNEAERVREHKEAFEEKVEKEGRTLVRVRDPRTGRTIVEPLAKAKSDGVADEDMEEVPAAEKSAIQDARLVMKMLNKKGDKAENKGILQLVDELDKEGKLGVVSSRLNSFLAGGVGTLPSDDPRIMSLLDKSQLAMTLTMKAHFGASGGRSPAMLEHFLSLAYAKKMDGPALRAGFRAIGDYMGDRAEMPDTGGGGGGGGKTATQANVEEFARKRNITTEEARKKFEAKGYTIAE